MNPLRAGDARQAGTHLSVNVNKVAQLRNARHLGIPSVVHAATLAALAEDADEAPTLRAFELVLLRELGWLPELDSATLTGQALAPEGRYALQPEAGVIAHADGLPGAAWVTLEAALSQGTTRALQSACVPVAAALRLPLRTLLHYHLGSQQLRTRDVWQGVVRLVDSR